MSKWGKRFEQIDKRFEQIDKRLEQVDKRLEQVDKRFEQVDKRFGQMQQWGVRVEEEIKHLRLDFQTMQHNMDTRFQDLHESFLAVKWMIGISLLMIGTMLTILRLFPS